MVDSVEHRCERECKCVELFDAVEAKDLELTETLLRKGGSVNARDKQGGSLLMLAASRERAGIVRLLLENGADVSIVNSEGVNALYCATVYRNYKSVLMLLDH